MDEITMSQRNVKDIMNESGAVGSQSRPGMMVEYASTTALIYLPSQNLRSCSEASAGSLNNVHLDLNACSDLVRTI